MFKSFKPFFLSQGVEPNVNPYTTCLFQEYKPEKQYLCYCYTARKLYHILPTSCHYEALIIFTHDFIFKCLVQIHELMRLIKACFECSVVSMFF